MGGASGVPEHPEWAGAPGDGGTLFSGSNAIVITQQPARTIGFLGAAVTLQLTATTTHGALRYQWRKGGVNVAEDPPRVTGTQTAALRIAAVLETDEGDYDVWLTDDCGSLVSDVAHLLVPPVGDTNCDGVVDFGDINPFVLILSNPAGYQQQYPQCRLLQGDCNGDGLVDFGDINAFVALLSGP